jgi:hypothetical protein
MSYFQQKRYLKSMEMKNMKIGKLRKETMAAFALLALGLVMPLAAKEKAKGAEVLVQKKDGQRIKAELLAVKDGRLILMDASTFSDVTCAVDDIRSLQIVKKAKVLKGLGLGSLTGGVAGSGLGFLSGNDKPGFMSFTAGQKALVLGVGLAAIGGLIGGVSGALTGIDDSVDLEGRSSQDIESILRKLDKEARFSQGLPKDSLKLTPVPRREKVENMKETELSLPGKTRPANSSSQELAAAKFRRFHLTYRPGYSRSQAASRCASLFREIGFGDTRPAQEISFFGISFGTIPATRFPTAAEKRNVTYGDVRVDYSITRKLAVGVGASSLGESEVNGFRYIPVNRGGRSYYSELYLKASSSGRLYYFLVSWMPLPDVFLRKTSFVLGAGAGWGRLNLRYSTSKTSSFVEPNNQIGFSKDAIALMGTAELNYFFNRTLSLGLNVEYRYAPVGVGSLCLAGSYYDLDEDSQLIESAALVTVPEHKLNSGGFRFGMSIGFHL